MTARERLDAATEITMRILVDLGKDDLHAAAIQALKLRLLLCHEPAGPAPTTAEVPRPWSDTEKEGD